MDANNNIVPHILCAMYSEPGKRQSLSNIVQFVENRLKEDGKEVMDLKNEVERALQVANDLGLISTNSNTVRLRFNPTSKPPDGFRGSVEEWEEAMDEDEAQNDTNTKTEDPKPKPSKTSEKRSSSGSIFGPMYARRRKRRSGGRSKRRRSRSSRRRRRH